MAANGSTDSGAMTPPGRDTDRSAGPTAVREGETPWTEAELAQVRADLVAEAGRLRDDIAAGQVDLGNMLKEPPSGACGEKADGWSRSMAHEREMSLVTGARDGLNQALAALERLDAGTYGTCESCGQPIGKHRLQAYPRAALCLSCKSEQERE